MTSLWAFFPLFAAEWRRLAVTLLLCTITLLAGVMLLGVSGWFLTATATVAVAASFNLFVPSALVRGLSLLRILSRYGEKLTGHDTTLRLLTRIRVWLFGRLFSRLPIDDRSLRHGDLVSRLTADVDALDSAFLVALGPLATAAIAGAAMTTALAMLLPPAAILYAGLYATALVAVPAGLVLAGRSSGKAVVDAQADLRVAALDGIDGHADLIALGAVAEHRRAFDACVGRLARGRRHLAWIASLGAGSIQLIAAMALLGVLWFGLDALARDELGAPLLVGLLLACLGSFEALGVIVRSVAKLGAAAAAADRLLAVATAPASIQDPAIPATFEPGRLCLDHVRFGHDPDHPVLDGVSLDVPVGHRVAIVGPSGAGKSTLAELVLRLRDPQAGRVLIGATDLRTVRQEDLHRHVALLGQSAPVFIGTIRSNLLIARPDADDAALWQALDDAQLGDVVRSLPDGLDTAMGEAGHSLSTGQVRRLCLARTLLSPAGILVFDEPTSGLDRATEQAFLADLARTTQGRTVLLITHAELPAGTVDATWRLRDGKLVPQRASMPATAVNARLSTMST